MPECPHYFVRTYETEDDFLRRIRICSRCETMVEGWGEGEVLRPALSAKARSEIEAILAEAL